MVCCPACQSEAPDGSRYCPSCGAQLDEQSSAPTVASSAAPTLTPTSAPTQTGSGSTVSPPSDERGGFGPGTVIAGRYRIEKPVGRGGMGEVWLAEQQEPVRRKVAFKVIKHGMDTGQVVTRFEAERQALAVMDHPAVAKVLDAGSTPGGRPFFVMEYVPGEPITRFCDENRLTTRKRLELFQRVCEGVQHAHQKAIIHRDLKPSNVLVSAQNGTPVPKIIDFGIAKAIDQKLTDETMLTQMGVLIGTPEYMSPEQAQLTGQNVDTRSDVYSLGVMLYELLVGKLPFESKELREAGYEGIRRKICEEDPMTPSHRFGTLGDMRGESADNRQTDPSTLGRELAGDLDWVTMKALEKDPDRRYGSPMDLAADVQCFLENRPVQARPPSVGYRASKFVRRHRWGVALAASLTVALIAGTVGTAVGLVRARKETRKARAVTDYLVNALSEANPEKAQGREITVREALEASGQKVAEAFAKQPELEMEVRATIAQVHHDLAQYADAEEHLRRAVELAEREIGHHHKFTVGVRGRLARALMDAGRYGDAEDEFRELLPVFRKVYGDEHHETLAVMHNLAAVYLHQKRYAPAEPLLVEVVEGRRKVLGEDDSNTQSSVANLAHLYMFTERLKDAEPLLREGLAVRRSTLGDRHPRTLISVFNLGDLYHRMGRDAKAEPLMREALDGFREVVGESHPYTLETLGGLASALVGLEKFEEAEALALENHRLRGERFGADHALTAEAADVLVEIYEETGRPEEATRYRPDP
jgi:serine/threonine protein kinase/tetratricopeptide (TPR) repeat protein